MKAILVVLMCFASATSLAGWGVFAGARSGTLDSSSFPSSGTVTYTANTQTTYEAGAFYRHLFNSWFGARVGAEVAQMSSSFSYTIPGFGNGAGTVTSTAFAAPLLLEAQLGSHFSVLAGGFYWTGNSVSCSYTGLSAGSACVMGQGAGFGPQVGAGIMFTPSIELDLFYEPKVQASPAVGTSPAWTVTTIVADLVYNF